MRTTIEVNIPIERKRVTHNSNVEPKTYRATKKIISINFK